MALSPFFFGFWTKPFLKEKRLFYYPELNLHKILYTTANVFTYKQVTNVYNQGTDRYGFPTYTSIAIPTGALSNISSADISDGSNIVFKKTTGEVVVWQRVKLSIKEDIYGYVIQPLTKNIKSVIFGPNDMVCITNSNVMENYEPTILFRKKAIPSTISNSNIKQVAIGWNFIVALKNDGTVIAWGTTTFGGNVVPAGLTGVKSIATGYHHAIALKNDGTLVKWGSHPRFPVTGLPTSIPNVDTLWSAMTGDIIVKKTDASYSTYGPSVVSTLKCRIIFSICSM